MKHEEKRALVPVSDAAEPNYHVRLGMAYRHFDDVMLLLVQDGEPSEPDWYGTRRTHDRRPASPLLLFSNGHVPALLDALAWLAKHAQDGL